MELTVDNLRDLLVRPGHISEADFAVAEREAGEEEKKLEDQLINKDLIKDEQLGKLIADSLGFPFLNLGNEKVDEAVLREVPELVARRKGIIAFGRDAGKIKAGMRDPGDLDMVHILEKRFGAEIKPYYITARDLKQALIYYQADLRQEYKNILNNITSGSATGGNRDKLIVRLVDILLEYGHFNKASDIHIEPYDRMTAVRYRIDGVMHKLFAVPKEISDLIIARLKILARMRIDEHMAAQDGKFRFNMEENEIDVRVSIVPVTAGENVVMRLLSVDARKLGLDELGFSAQDLEKVRQASVYPYGMILVTGPTGSGKTTTVYEILKILNKPEVHIASIEDPVEYDIEGVSQIQVNPKTGLTFAQGLRAIVRQDPDIIMVGEIRDAETAGIAVNSAMTGHLVLSTLHANDAVTTLPRLLDMGIEPYLITSTVNLVVAQRLVRMICEKCRASCELSDEERVVLGRDRELRQALKNRLGDNYESMTFYRGQGCKVCANTGYHGRIGVFEVLRINNEIKNLIIKKAANHEILDTAKTNGMTTILEDGLDKVVNGITTLSEIIRVSWK